MKGWRTRRAALAFLALFPPAPSLAHAVDLWSGSWVFVGARSLSVPPSLAIEQSGSHYVIRSASRRAFDCDGRDHVAPLGTLRCIANEPELVLRLTEGKIHTRMTYQVQTDGRTLVETVVTTWPETPGTTKVLTYRRAIASSALAGAWTGVPVAPLAERDTLQLRIHDGGLYLRDAGDGEVTDARLDGAPAPFSSLGLPAGARWSNVLVSERRIEGYSMTDSARHLSEVFSLSPDGETLTVTSPQRPGSYDVFIKR